MKILLAEPDPDQLDITAYALQRQGFRVASARDGRETISKWRSESPDLIILESALPRLNGLEVCRVIREKSQVPVIFVSEKSSDQEVVSAFNTGADDYVFKPFSASQLVARIRAALRRAANSRTRADGLYTKVAVGSLMVDSEKHRVMVNGDEVHLTPLEFRLLYCLAANKGHVISVEQLIHYAWGLRDGGDTGALKTHISRIRQKLEVAGPEFQNIKNVPGIGYSLAD